MNECLARIGSLEESVVGLQTSVVKLETKLETVIEERFKNFEENLKRMESTLTAKLDKIDEDIRGNGKDGINIRLDRLENSKKLTNRWFWILVGVAAPACEWWVVVRFEK